MTPLQRRIFLILSIAIALTRLLAVARSLFDWDEALFARGVREYDVSVHSPHPPGYPLFVGAAKLVHLLGVNEFRALQTIVVLGAIFLFPALVWLGRELGFGFTTAAAGAAMYAFFPNVWLYGGTGFSDVPAATLVFAACALLLRGRRDARAYILGAVVLGVATGIRPASLLVGAVPALLATWARIRAKDYRAVAAAMLLGAVIVAASYAGAALATGNVQHYVDAVRAQSKYVREIDSFRNPGRGPLSDAAKTFWLYPFWAKDVLNGVIISALVALVAAVVRRRKPVLLAFAVFAPLAITSWLNLDINTASRYAIGYMALHALLAADGFRVIGRRKPVQVALSVAVIGVFVAMFWPGVRIQRTTDAPPAGALNWIVRNVKPGTPVYVYAGFGPHASYLLPDHDPKYFEHVTEIDPAVDAWVVDDNITEHAHNFVRPHYPLWKVLRRRAFEASVSRASGLVRYGEGWHGEEGEGTNTWRWTASEAKATLPRLKGNGRLAMHVAAPVDALPAPPVIEVFVNGALVERFTGTAGMDRAWTVASRTDAPNELRIVTSATINPAQRGESDDTRDLGLRISKLSWTPVR